MKNPPSVSEHDRFDTQDSDSDAESEHSDFESAKSNTESTISSTETAVPNTEGEQPASPDWTVSDRDKSILYGFGQSLVCLGFLNLALLVACIVFSCFHADALDIFGDDCHPTKLAGFLGIMIGIISAIFLAAITHVLDKKNWVFQIFWIQALALPGGYLASLYPLLEGKLRAKVLLYTVVVYAFANLLLGCQLGNFPDSSDDTVDVHQVGWALSLLPLSVACILSLVKVASMLIDARIAENPSAVATFIFGSGIGLVVMGSIVQLSDTFLHVFENKGLLQKLFYVELLGVIPGGCLVGGSSRVAKLFVSQPGYSTVGRVDQSNA